MADTTIPVSSGIAIFQALPDAGGAPQVAPETMYTVSKWEVATGVQLGYVSGPRGVTRRAFPVGMMEQTITVDFQEAPLRVESVRLMGTTTYGAANTSQSIAYLADYDIKGGLKASSAIKTALEALTLNSTAPPAGLYQITLSGSDAPTMQKISPVAETVTDTTIFSAALTSATFTVTTPPSGSGGRVIFAINAAEDGSFETTFDVPRAPRMKISCYSDFELGNAFRYVEIGEAVPQEPTWSMERGNPINVSQTYRILNGSLTMGQRSYSHEAGAA